MLCMLYTVCTCSMYHIMLHAICDVCNALYAVYVTCYTYDVLCMLHIILLTVCYMLCITHVRPMCVACYMHMFYVHMLYCMLCIFYTVLHVVVCAIHVIRHGCSMQLLADTGQWSPVPRRRCQWGGRLRSLQLSAPCTPSCSCCRGSQAQPRAFVGSTLCYQLGLLHMWLQ